MITLEKALEIRASTYGPGYPQAGAIKETDTYWWLDHAEPCIGSGGIIIDKTDGHVHLLGSVLPLEEWLYAHDHGFRHREYAFRISAIRNVDRTFHLLRKMRYEITEEMLSGPALEMPFGWMQYPHLPSLTRADYLTFEFSVKACDHAPCTAIGTILPNFTRAAVPAHLNRLKKLDTATSRRLSEADHKALALWAATCAEHVLPNFEDNRPGDLRTRDGIAAARAWARGQIKVGQARSAAFAAHAAARDTTDKQAQSAARAAGHAAAIAHVAGHAPHAADCAAKSASDPAIERQWQFEQLPETLRFLLDNN